MVALRDRPHHDALGSGFVSYESVTPRSPATGPSAEEIAAKSFPSARRGVDPDAVHRYLMEVATTLRDARRREELLRTRIETLERAEPQLIERPAEEDGLAEALGAETVKVLQAAREAARDLIGRGERRAQALVADAEATVAEQTRYAAEEAEALLARTRAEASEILDSTRSQARTMVEQAREARRRILTDLAERRRTLHLQLEQLRAGKESLSGVLDRVSESMLAAMDEVRGRLDGADEAARAAAQAAVESARFSDDDLRIDAPPSVEAPSVSADLAASLSGDRALTERPDPLALPKQPLPSEARRADRSADGSEGEGKRQGIDELFARIRESRQLEVAETRAQIEAVERELSAPLPSQGAMSESTSTLQDSTSSPPVHDASPTVYDAEAVQVEEREQAATLFSSVVEADERDDEPSDSLLLVTESQGSEPDSDGEPQPDFGQAPSAQAEPGSANSNRPVALDGGVDPNAERASSASLSEDQADDSTAALSIFERRDLVLNPSAADLARALKRTLRMEQNELLDAARHLKRPQEALALLPAEPMASRVSAAALVALQSAWHAGSDFVADVLGEHEQSKRAIEPEGQTELAEISRLLAIEVVDPIRRRMDQGLTATGVEASGISEAVTAGFRDWRASKIDELASDYAHRVFARSVISAGRERKLKLSWVVDDGGTNCPDCDDNALSGPTIAGSLFPTGHSHPPIHPACHCVLIPVRE